jgi:hypothetical protein
MSDRERDHGLLNRIAALPQWAFMALGALLWLVGMPALYCVLHWAWWGEWPAW